MKNITYEQYLKHKKNSSLIGLKEDETDYEIQGIEERNYDEKKLKEIDKKHDKMFRNILSKRKEMAKFLNQFLEPQKEIKEEQIIQCPTDFITRRYKSKQPDIIYKLKNKPIYFLVEHQSTVEKNMPLRILEYMTEIVRKEIKMQNIKKKIYPIVVPIVIYTGCKKWNAKINFAQKQYQSKEYQKFETNLEYNLIDLQNYTFKELLEKKSLFGSIMIIEKCKTQDEMETQIYRIIETIEDTEDKEILAEIIDNIIRPCIGDKIANEILEKLKRKEEFYMSPVTKMFLDLEIKFKNEERRKTIMEIVKNMLRLGETEEKIIKYNGITKEELEEIKGLIANSN